MQRICQLFLALSLISASAFAQDAVIDITKRGTVKSTISLSGIACGGTAATSFKSVLQSDLQRSGWFKVAAPGDAVIKIDGSCAEQAGRLSARLRVKNVATGRTRLEKVFENADTDYRALAHRVSDAIVTAIKGVPAWHQAASL
jgi:hypothetical protein